MTLLAFYCKNIKNGILKYIFKNSLVYNYLKEVRNCDNNGTYSNSSEALIFLNGSAAHSHINLRDWFIS